MLFLAWLTLPWEKPALAVERPAPGRVVVFDVQTDGTTGSGVAQLPDLMGQLVASHPGFPVVPDAEVHRALLARQQEEPRCQLSAQCRNKVARDLQAQLSLFASLVRSEGQFVLYLSLSKTDGGAPPATVSQPMKQLAELRQSVESCLALLFRWTESPGASSSPSTRLRVGEETIPPIEDRPPEGSVVVRPAPPEPPAHSGAQRVLVLDLRGVDVEPAVVAPFSHLIAAHIALHGGYDVASPDDVNRLFQSQSHKEAAGCAQDTACLVELSRKLSADVIVNGTVGRIGSTYTLALSAIPASRLDGARRELETAQRPEDLPAAIPACLDRLFRWGAVRPPVFQLPKEKKLSFAVFDLRPTGLTEAIAANLTQVLTNEVKSVDGASVVSRDDIAALLQLESTRRKVGCEDAGCMAEIGGALGVDRLITGDAGKVGSLFLVSLRLLDVRRGVVENRVTEGFEGNEEQLLRAVRFAARRLLGLEMSGKGELEVTSSQTTSNVFVDGAGSGKAPTRVVNLVPGKHALRVAANGFYDYRSEVYVDPLEPTSVWAELRVRPQAWYQRWWVWTIAGAVVAGATVAAIVGTRQPSKTDTGTVIYGLHSGSEP